MTSAGLYCKDNEGRDQMANRSMQQKQLKLKRMKRLFPKSYSADYIHVGSRPGPAHELVTQRKDSVRSLAFDAKYGEYLAEAKFKNVPPGRVEAREAALRISTAEGKLNHYLSVALNEMPATWARLKDICPLLMNVVLEDSGIRHVRMFWNASRDKYILLELHHIGRYMRASMVYQDDKRLKERFKSEQVRWVEFVSSSPPKPND